MAALGNTEQVRNLFTASLGMPATRLVMGLSFAYDGDPDPDVPAYVGGAPLPAAADGDAILFYATCTIACDRRIEGAIYRLAGRRPQLLAGVENPAGLAVSDRRFAVATNSPRCCNDTPTWSHDGTRLAWIHRGDLWTIRADGTRDRRLATRASLPSWSPDDTRIVFERRDERRRGVVYAIDAAGGRAQRLAVGTGPVWSPNGTRIAFIRGRDVYTIDPRGAAERKLTSIGRETAGPLSWSPDSTRIAVARGGFIYSVRADGGGETRLTPGGQPAWSPDGSRIAYAANGIGLVNADGTGVTRVTRTREDGAPAWSPDSGSIAFARVTGTYSAELWVTNADGTRQRRPAPSVELISPQWSPNGAWIAGGDTYGEGDFPRDPGIHLVSPTHGKSTRIAPVLRAAVQIRDVVTGRVVERFTTGGHASALALGPDYVALVVDHRPGVRVEVYDPRGNLRRAVAVSSHTATLSAAGRNVVFADRRAIRLLAVKTGAVSTLGTAGTAPVGLTIEDRRVVWAENRRGMARIRAVRAR